LVHFINMHLKLALRQSHLALWFQARELGCWALHLHFVPN
jgi:hypothetical protein